MNHFVDFGKRSIELSLGCKDLLDVIQHNQRRANLPIVIRVGQSLGDVRKKLDSLLVPSARSKNLVIAWGNLSYIHLQNKEQILTATVVVHEGVLREQSVRSIFSLADLAPISDEIVAGAIRALQYSFPVTAPIIGRLIPNLLFKGFGLALRQVKYELGNWEEESC